MSLTDTLPRPTADLDGLPGPELGGQELAAFIAAKLCHDFISPAGAITSGLDLLKDPSAQDMRDDAMSLIEQSARKLVAIVNFARVAFGAATTSERFSAAELEPLINGMFDGGRASLSWQPTVTEFSKIEARALLNLAHLTGAALPSGGVATVTALRDADGLRLEGVAEGARARLKPEARTGLAGERLTEGLAGQWIQPFWLWLTVAEAGGTLAVDAGEGRVVLTASMPS